MFKPVHNVYGTLSSPLNALSNVMGTDPATYQTIADILGVEDHTYLRVGVAPSCEVVRVWMAADGVLLLDRGIDGTTPYTFGEGTVVSYVLAAAGVNDLLEQAFAPNVLITAVAPLVVTQTATNQFTLSQEEVVLGSDDGSVDVIGTWPNINLAINRAATGC